MEFYDFLQVNADSNKSEVIDHTTIRSRENEFEVEQQKSSSILLMENSQINNNNNGLPYYDFLSVQPSA